MSFRFNVCACGKHEEEAHIPIGVFEDEKAAINAACKAANKYGFASITHLDAGQPVAVDQVVRELDGKIYSSRVAEWEKSVSDQPKKRKAGGGT